MAVEHGDCRAKLICSDKKCCLAIESNLPELLTAFKGWDNGRPITAMIIFLNKYPSGHVALFTWWLKESCDSKQTDPKTYRITCTADYSTLLTIAQNLFKKLICCIQTPIKSIVVAFSHANMWQGRQPHCHWGLLWWWQKHESNV